LKKIAVFGSRGWPASDPHAFWVKDCIEALYLEHGMFVLVSGGADGASKLAEQTALDKGLPVVSFRPVKLRGGMEIPDEYGVDEWRLFRGAGEIIHHHAPTWATFEGAAWFRSVLMADRAEEGNAFWDGHSPGTQVEIGLFADAKKPCKVTKA
jgi:hypothetical protein